MGKILPRKFIAAKGKSLFLSCDRVVGECTLALDEIFDLLFEFSPCCLISCWHFTFH